MQYMALATRTSCGEDSHQCGRQLRGSFIYFFDVNGFLTSLFLWGTWLKKGEDNNASNIHIFRAVIIFLPL